ncbi:MAG TPA: sigma-70 family RNA polymerase sigma factor [Pyrinomonadaceae bacterium]|jgi:RNA polymerase sigma factor (TIGR02999 family)|nr:sigma-70 family RNA polymerase sigma factor [Pyrinomonadaceae bacterium]
MTEISEVTQLLNKAQKGDKEALDVLFPVVYKELRRVASHQLADERANHTLQPTALVHEAYLRLIGQHSVDWNNRAHFFSIAAEMMRRILVNHALEKKAQKRGAGETLISMEEISGGPAGEAGLDVLLLDETLHRLAEMDERQSKIVELRFFGGLSVAETADVLKISEATINREWRSAKAWIMAQMK